MKVLLDNGLDFDDLKSVKNGKGETILDLAIREDNVKAFEMLVKGNSSLVNEHVVLEERYHMYTTPHVSGKPTPLHKAAYHNAVNVAAYLIDHGAIVDVQEEIPDWAKGGDEGTTPLHVAAARGSLGKTNSNTFCCSSF